MSDDVGLKLAFALIIIPFAAEATLGWLVDFLPEVIDNIVGFFATILVTVMEVSVIAIAYRDLSVRFNGTNTEFS